VAEHRKEIANETYGKLREKYVIVVETAKPQVDAAPQSGGVASAATRQ
jgi:hypothetical protein